jgi:hypothetical protein
VVGANAFGWPYLGQAYIGSSGAATVERVEPVYGSGGVPITITLASLADGSAREATAVDNSTDLFLDALVTLKTKTGPGTIGSDPYLYLYVIGTDDSGTTWPDPATGADAAITPTLNTKARLLGAVNLAAVTTAYIAGPFSVLAAFGGVAIPKKWSIVAVNSCGVALSSTAGDHVLSYQGQQLQV